MDTGCKHLITVEGGGKSLPAPSRNTYQKPLGSRKGDREYSVQAHRTGILTCFSYTKAILNFKLAYLWSAIDNAKIPGEKLMYKGSKSRSNLPGYVV